MRNFADVNKGNLTKEVNRLRAAGCKTPYATAAEKFRCSRHAVRSYFKNMARRRGLGRGGGQNMTTDELMEYNDRIVLKRGDWTVYTDAKHKARETAFLEEVAK